MRANNSFTSLHRRSKHLGSSIKVEEFLKQKTETPKIELRPRSKSLAKLPQSRIITKPSSIKDTKTYKLWVAPTNSGTKPQKKIRKINPIHRRNPSNQSEQNGYLLKPRDNLDRSRFSLNKTLNLSQFDLGTTDSDIMKQEASSKWFFNDGSYEWRDCKVSKYDSSLDKYLIQWPNGKQKLVARINLKYLDDRNFELRINQAHELREITRNNYLTSQIIASMVSPVPHFPLKMFESILGYIKGSKVTLTPKNSKFSITSVPEPFEFTTKGVLRTWENEVTHLVDFAALCSQLKVETVQEAKRIYFSNLKPISIQLKDFSIQITPSQQESIYNEIEESFKYGVHKYEYMKSTGITSKKHVPYRGVVEHFDYDFKQSVHKMNKILVQAHPGCLRILQTLHQHIMSFKKLIFFCKEYAGPFKLEFYEIVNKAETDQVIEQARNISLDLQFSIQDIVNRAHEERVARNNERLKRKVYHSQSIELENSLSPNFCRRVSALIDLSFKMMEQSIRKKYFKSVQEIAFQVQKELRSEEIFSEKKSFPSRFPSIKAVLVFEDSQFKIQPDIKQIKTVFLRTIHYPIERVNNMQFAELTTIPPRQSRNPLLLSALDTSEILASLDKAWELPSHFLGNLSSYAFVMQADTEKIMNKHKKKFNGDKILRLLYKYLDAREMLQSIFMDREELQLGLIFVNIKSVSSGIIAECDKMIDTVKEILIFSLHEQISIIKYQEEEVLDVVKYDPGNLEELMEIKLFIQNQVTGRMHAIQSELLNLGSLLEMINESQLLLPSDELYSAWVLFQIPKQIRTIISSTSKVVGEREKVFVDDLTESLQKLLVNVSNLEDELEVIKKEQDMKKFPELKNQCTFFKAKMEIALDQSKTINLRQGLIKTQLTNFKVLENVKREFLPFYRLWGYIDNFLTHKPQWKKKLRLAELNKDIISEETDLISKELTRMINSQFRDMPEALTLAKAFKRKVDRFTPYVPLIQSLKNLALKERHWEQMQRVTGVAGLNKNLSMNLRDLIKEGVMRRLEEIEDISERASKEHVLEKQKHKMEKDWEDVRFRVDRYKNSEFIIIVEPEYIAEIIDDHIIKTSSMYNSPYVDFIRKDIYTWKASLQKYQDILEEWIGVQNNWQYLYPLFQNKDINDQIPAASKMFRQVHEFVKYLMEIIRVNELVIEAFSSSPKLLERLRVTAGSLDQIAKSLNDYLNTKRKLFPRFYFVSDDELLGILSRSKDLGQISSFISKCFEGVERLEFENNTIISMISPEEEVVELSKPVNLLENGELKYVENWMSAFEDAMRVSLRQHMSASAEDRVTRGLVRWIECWPSQLVHAVATVNWTEATETALVSGRLALDQHAQKLKSALAQLVETVRSCQEALTRRTISTCIVIDVHNRDIVDELLHKQVESIQDFEWLAQLRYYMDSRGVIAQMVDTVQSYDYEYIGNQTRLVMTTLTDRCFRTLMSALRLSLGGAPEGPAGTGKTETIKDLAKALAIKCVVFNCSDRLDHLSMAKFFTGLVSCGAWSCFDEFNRIETEVLSVIAEQILSIQNALIAQVSSFVFVDEPVPLVPSCAIFITMNPDYAGRSQLPDNLKALFRPVAMMIPEYSMIAEIYLYSYGFKEARKLSVKLITSLRLASEQLSEQHHYDYGMRTVIAIINTAGTLKREDGSQDESKLLLKALCDANLPKFLDQDIDLFQRITVDLFPKIENFKQPNVEFLELSRAAMKELGLAPNDGVLDKVLQLNDLMRMRHGIMLIGDTFSCKTTLLRILAKALSLQGSSPTYMWLFPKAIPPEQLYGDTDPNSHDWIDGILSHYLRGYCSEGTEGKKWIVCDGPVDPVWIETMNTVLDDNKKLCLTSGEIIKLTPNISMIFEVDSLSAASPATVSRCGMIYLYSEGVLTVENLFESWLNNVPLGYHFDRVKEFMAFLFENIGKPCLFRTRILTQNRSVFWLTKNLLTLFECLLMKKARNKLKHNEEFKELLHKYLRALEAQKQQEAQNTTHRKTSFRRQSSGGFSNRAKRDILSFNNMVLVEDKITEKYLVEITNSFLFAIIWSLGSVISEEGRSKFDILLREIYTNFIKENQDTSNQWIISQAYHQESCYKMEFNTELGIWEPWKIQDSFMGRSDIDLNTLHVPTLDTVAYQSIVRAVVSRGTSVLIVGSTGTGKSVLTKKVVSVIKSESDKFSVYFNTFSPRSSAPQVQDIIFSKLAKRKKNTYGAELGKAYIIVIDDMHMPTPEPETGAQPPNELLRQMIDKQEWFKHNCEMHKLEDLIYLTIASDNNAISKRLLRHMFLIKFNQFSRESLANIFGSYLALGFQNHSEFVSQSIPLLTEGTIEIYEKTHELLLPTPAKTHYQFNLRDISNVFRGMITVPSAKIPDFDLLCRLWAHECLRVFSDRLINTADLQIFSSILLDTLESKTKTALPELKSLLFCNYLEEKVYQECPSLENAKNVLELYLEDYNAIKSNKTMDLELFDFAVEHISRITRVLNTPISSGLLIGLGGSGRLSLSKLSAFAIGHHIFSIAPTKNYGIIDWNDDIKKVLYKAGVECKNITFILRETDLKNEAFLENINNLLNNGEIPNLHTREDKETIAASLKKIKGKEKETEEKYEDFVTNVRNNLHILMCFSPVGSALRKRLRLFPSLVNCCTINWFFDWPHEALISLADKQINEADVASSLELKEDIKKICVNFHLTAKALSSDYFNEKKRVNYVTPFNFLTLFSNMKNMHKIKKQSTVNIIDKYTKGVELLKQAGEDINKLTDSMNQLKPVLEDKTQQTEKLMAEIKWKNADADLNRKTVAEEQHICSLQAETAEAIKQECEDILSQAIPVLEAAKRAIRKLDKKELVLVKNMQKPPEPIRIVIESVVILNNKPPVKVPDPENKGRFIWDYWEAGKKMMIQIDFLKNLLNFNEETITSQTISKLQPYLKNPKFDPEVVKYSSKSAEGLCKWVRAMHDYYFISNDIKPKEAALEQATQELRQKLKALHYKESELKRLEDFIRDLQEEYQEKNQAKVELEQKILDIEQKANRANVLINKLGSERTRWEENAFKISSDLESLLGDTILAAAVSSYLGNFIGTFRDKILTREWLPFIRNTSLVCSKSFSLREVLGKPAEIQKWVQYGLPNDTVSIENAIIMSHNENWPLIVDPQNQANKWIKAIKKEENLVLAKSNASDLSRLLENAMANGACFLLENVEENLDTNLDPLLNRAFFYDGNSLCIKIGDSFKPFDKNFKLIMTCPLARPVFSPEVMSQTTVLDFSITQKTLAEQLLSLVCSKELPKETEELGKLVALSAKYAKDLQDSQDRILELIQTSGDKILEDEELVQNLTKSKQTAEELEFKLAIVEKNQARIIHFQEAYHPISNISSVLYFCTADMANIDPVYVFSMERFIGIFTESIENAPQNSKLEEKIENMILDFRKSLFTKISMSLFERDRLVFTFLMAIRLLEYTQGLDAQEWKFLLTGYLATPEETSNEHAFDQKIWKNIGELSMLSSFYELKTDICRDPERWKEFIQKQSDSFNLDHFDNFTSSIPPPYNQTLTQIQKLCLIRAVRPEDMMNAIKSFIYTTFGEFYLNPPITQLSDVLEVSTPLMPLIFILTPGNDPQSRLAKFAEQCDRNLVTMSLGKGQGEQATEKIEKNMYRGNWVLLQNCHLAISWLSSLQNLFESVERVNFKFRIWMTTISHPEIPVSLLKSGLIIISENPKGLKTNLKNIYGSIAANREDSSLFYNATKPYEWRKLLFSLSFFHCVVRERFKFGSIGWNIQYSFNDSDFSISMRQLKDLLETNHQTPFKSLIYLVSECNYGGKVTDDWDRRMLRVLINDFYSDKVLTNDFALNDMPAYKFPPYLEALEDYIEFIDQLPYQEIPEVFGLNANASITCARKEMEQFLQRILDLQPQGSTSAAIQDLGAVSIAQEILKALPGTFDIDRAVSSAQRDYMQSLNIVLCQELTKFNVLVSSVRNHLSDVLNEVEASHLMSQDLEEIRESILINRVPQSWKKFSFESCKPLSSWVTDINNRFLFFNRWLSVGIPEVVWISGLFYPQAFFTAILQNEARTNPEKPEIDSLKFDYSVCSDFSSNETFNLQTGKLPESGCLINGLFLEGAQWKNGVLEESPPRELFSVMPIIHIIPTGESKKKEGMYDCPVYKTSLRSGNLTTTGHSSNYVITMTLPTHKPENYWVKRGVALITQLDD